MCNTPESRSALFVCYPTAASLVEIQRKRAFPVPEPIKIGIQVDIGFDDVLWKFSIEIEGMTYC